MSNLKALVPMHSAGLVGKSPSSTAVTVSKGALPATVQSGIRNILLAFSAGPSLPSEDRIQTLRLYADACDGFERGIVEYVLQYLVFHNPRNPFAPTPQNLFELCEKTSMIWRIRAARYRLLVTYGCSVTDEYANWPGDIWQADWGPAPGEPGCLASEALVMAGVRDRIKFHEKSLIELPDERFAGIPFEAFPEGYHSYIAAKREKRTAERLKTSLDVRSLGTIGDIAAQGIG